MRADLLYGAFFTILKAVPRTLFIALIVMASAIVLGVFLAFLRMKRVKIISPLIGLLVGYTRGTPMIVQLFIVYYSLPYGIAYMANRFFAADIKAFDVPGLILYARQVTNVKSSAAHWLLLNTDRWRAAIPLV